MKTIWLGVAVVALGLTAASAAGMDPVLNDVIVTWKDDPTVNCKKADTTFAMDVCAGRVTKKTYLEMVALYNKLYAKYDAPNRKLLQSSQRAWHAYLDAECAYENALTDGGSMHSMMMTNCTGSMAVERIKQLKAQLNCAEGDASCNNPG